MQRKQNKNSEVNKKLCRKRQELVLFRILIPDNHTNFVSLFNIISAFSCYESFFGTCMVANYQVQVKLTTVGIDIRDLAKLNLFQLSVDIHREIIWKHHFL